MSITALPDPPSRSDPANFPERADAFMAALPQFATEANVLQGQVNEAAETAEDYKDAAGSSATAANGSAAIALLSETHAQGSAVAAAQARTDSETARDLAQDWAAKPSGAVDGTAFLSAMQYAELAAAGAGLPIYATIPTTDKGLIAVPGQGVMAFDGTSRYITVTPMHGRVQLRQQGTATVKLFPKDGNELVINRRVYHIPDGGTNALSAPTTLGTYLIYAYDNGAGVAAIEANIRGSFPHSMDPSNGVEIMTGQPTRTLVGVAYSDGTKWLNEALLNGAVSYFNRSRIPAIEFVSEVSTTSAVPTAITTPLNVWLWANEAVEAKFSGSMRSSAAGATIAVSFKFDGIDDLAQSANPYGAGAAIPFCLVANKAAAEGYHNVAGCLYIGGGATATINAAIHSVSICSK